MGQALDQLSDLMPFVQGRHEQSLAHLAIGYAKALNAGAPPSRSPRRSARVR